MSGRARLSVAQLSSWGGVGGNWLTPTREGLWSCRWASGLIVVSLLFASMADKEIWGLFALAMHMLTLPTKVLGNRGETDDSREAQKSHSPREGISGGCAFSFLVYVLPQRAQGVLS